MLCRCRLQFRDISYVTKKPACECEVNNKDKRQHRTRDPLLVAYPSCVSYNNQDGPPRVPRSPRPAFRAHPLPPPLRPLLLQALFRLASASGKCRGKLADSEHLKFLKFVDYRCDRSTWIVAVGSPCQSPRTLTRGAIQYRCQTCYATHICLILKI